MPHSPHQGEGGLLRTVCTHTYTDTELAMAKSHAIVTTPTQRNAMDTVAVTTAVGNYSRFRPSESFLSCLAVEPPRSAAA
ncbi:GD19731 [Drosophila simulans]|uniref:GD19731 n=1 Tax=Drosophila simulans TaxID=7240 RepID=B4QVH9_DROSI|nr:GD19731 [Drosophila simulans]